MNLSLGLGRLGPVDRGQRLVAYAFQRRTVYGYDKRTYPPTLGLRRAAIRLDSPPTAEAPARERWPKKARCDYFASSISKPTNESRDINLFSEVMTLPSKAAREAW